MKSFKLTVLTETIHESTSGFTNRVKSFLRPLKYLVQEKKLLVKKKYGGHYAVTRSLIEGLQKTGTDFNYNPVDEENVADNVIVLAGVETLQKAIALKNKNKIKKLFAGPNICESPAEENGILADGAIDCCIVPSAWVESFYLQEKKELEGRIKTWHAGVDTNYWQPSLEKKEREVIVYWKTEGQKFCEAIENILKENNYNPVRIKYGKYTSNEYKEVLDIAQFAVFISRNESQGIALTEAWSMNVPTYVWDPGKFIYKNKEYSQASACPYLTNETGLRWIELDELKVIIEKTKQGVFPFMPRKHALQSFSDEQCASDLISKFQQQDCA